MDFDFKGLDLTTSNSFVTVVISQDPKGFLVTFPYNKKIFAKTINIPGALAGDDSPFPGMLYVPRERFNELKQAMGDNAIWRTKEDLDRDGVYFSKTQESLSDVLNRIDKNIDTSYMKINPYSFQKLAVSWAIENKGIKHSVVGGLLADQMGLGKTIEGLTTACKLKEDDKINNCLVICPATLKTQWQQEIEKFTNEDSVVIRTTNNKKAFESRQELYKKVKKENTFFTIINYELLYQRKVDKVIKARGKTASGNRKTKKVYGDFLDLNEIKKIGFDMVIIDEAHKMKNPDTLIARSIRQINSDYKLLMTGTPIEKELKNLFQLFDYINPNILIEGNISSFEERRRLFEEQYLLSRLNPFTYPAKEIEYFGEKNTAILRNKINPFMLRRVTEDVSDEMPSQIENKITVEFADFQLKLYKKITDEMKSTKNELKKIPLDDDVKREQTDNHFKALSQLRNITCDSPSVLLNSDSSITKRIVGKRKSFPKVPKVDRLLEMVNEICLDNKEKMVIFTRYARVAHYLQNEIQKMFEKYSKKHNQKPYNMFIYEGDTKEGCKYRDLLEKEGKDKRLAVCNTCPLINECETRTKYAWHFQNDNNTKVLIATDAANFGVNLQKGKHLINYDLPDSFSIYLQRAGRIRRLGSEHDQVFIYNLVTNGGVDEKKLKELHKQMKINDKLIENKDDDMEAIKNADKVINDIIDEI